MNDESAIRGVNHEVVEDLIPTGKYARPIINLRRSL